MRSRRRRLLILGAGAILLAGLGAVAAVRALDHPSWIYYCRLEGDRTLVLGTVDGPGADVRVTSVIETPTAVTVTVSSLLIELGPSAGFGVQYEPTATLPDPLGARTVIDGSSGLPIQRTHCLPPSYFAPGCTP
jgi:hypothetical protein